MAETLPIINGSSGVWGSILNEAIGNIDAKLEAAVAKNATQDTALATQAGKIAALENTSTVGLIAVSTSSNRPTASVGLIGLETDTGYLYYCASVGGVATRVPWPGSYLAKIKQTTAQNLPDNIATAITFQSADTNRLGGWSGGTAYVAQVRGIYEFTGAIAFGTNGTGARTVLWAVNGGTFNGGGSRVDAVSSYSTIVVARPAVISLNVGDSVTLAGIQTSGTTLATDVTTAGQSGMQVKYLGYYGS